MIVAKLTISYDRGTSLNRKSDLGTTIKRGDATTNGGIVRGLGSHFRSQADMIAAQTRDKEARRVYQAFREQFMTTGIDGLYVIPEYGAARKFVAGLNPFDITVRVAEFDLTTGEAGMDSAELAAWGARIKNQLTAVGLGRKKDIDVAGLNAIDALADCPLLTGKTRDAVKNLVSLLRDNKIDRAGFRKSLAALQVEINQIDQSYEKRAQKADAKAAWVGEAR